MPVRSAPRESIDVGDIQVTYLPDGEATVSATAMFPTGTQQLWDAHEELFDDDGKLLLTLGGILIRSGDRTIVVDLGFGDRTVEFPPVDGLFRSGRLLSSLREDGVAPEDVDTVFYTHMHIDHVGWTATGGALTFPNARHLAGAGEAEFWRSLDADHPLAGVGPEPDVLAALEGRIESVPDGTTLAPGVTVVATPGHTPGHCSLVVSSGQDRAIVLGDVIHCPAQLADNDVSLALDVDPELAARTRDAILAEIDGDPRAVAAPMHFPNSVFGRVMQGEARRHWSTPAAR